MTWYVTCERWTTDNGDDDFIWNKDVRLHKLHVEKSNIPEPLSSSLVSTSLAILQKPFHQLKSISPHLELLAVNLRCGWNWRPLLSWLIAHHVAELQCYVISIPVNSAAGACRPSTSNLSVLGCWQAGASFGLWCFHLCLRPTTLNPLYLLDSISATLFWIPLPRRTLNRLFRDTLSFAACLEALIPGVERRLLTYLLLETLIQHSSLRKDLTILRSLLAASRRPFERTPHSTYRNSS